MCERADSAGACQRALDQSMPGAPFSEPSAFTTEPEGIAIAMEPFVGTTCAKAAQRGRHEWESRETGRNESARAERGER